MGTSLLSRSPLQFPSTSDEGAWNQTAAGRSFSSRFSQSVPVPSLTQAVPNVSAVSTDPTQLAREITSGLDGSNVDLIPDGPSALFQRAARLLVGPDSGMTSSLASSLYQVMARQPGVTLLGTATDHLGRRGIAVSTRSANGPSALVLDPKSGLPLEVQYSPSTGFTPSSNGVATLQCRPTSECGSPSQALIPQGTDITVGPTWTDTETNEIVTSPGSRHSDPAAQA